MGGYSHLFKGRPTHDDSVERLKNRTVCFVRLRCCHGNIVLLPGKETNFSLLLSSTKSVFKKRN